MKRSKTDARTTRMADPTPRQSEESDGFRARHQLRRIAEREVDGVRRPVLINEAESPLGWLKSRKDRNGRPLISEDQFAAGERLRADYWFAHMPQRVTSNWSSLAHSRRSRRSAPNSAALRDEVNRGQGTGDAGLDGSRA
jgi:Domain of unknown function (DUF6456)